MTTIHEHRTRFRKGNTTYSVELSALPAEGGADSSRVVLSLAAAGPDGEPVADGQLEVDLDAAADLGTLVQQTLHGAAGLAAPERAVARVRPANQGLPWTEEADAELERRWIAGEGLAEIAHQFARSPGSIRAQLPRVGCDPERPGGYLPEPPSRRVS